VSTLTDRLRANGVNAKSTAQPTLSIVEKPESAYQFAAALWQESALERITKSLKGSAAHMAIGPLVAKLHAGKIDCGIAESVFISMLGMESENKQP